MNPNDRISASKWRSLEFWQGGSDIVALIKTAWVRFISVGINAGQAILLPLMVGPTTFGLFAGLYTNMMVAIGIGRGPIEILIQRGRSHSSDADRIIYPRRDLFHVYFGGLILAILLFIALSTIQRWPVTFGFSIVLGVAVFIGAASGLRRGLLISSNRTSELELLDMVTRPAVFLVAAGVCWWLDLIESTLIGLLGASFVLTLLWPNLKAVFAATTIPDGKESAFRPWSYLLASNGLSVLVKHADVIVLGMFMDAATVGRYFIVARIADLAAFGYSFATARFVHRFAVARREQDEDEVARLIARASGFGLAIASIIAGALIIAAPLVLPMIDPGLRGYLLPLALLVGAQVINASLGVRGAFLTAIDPRYTLGLKLLLNPMALVAMVLVVPPFGAIGAAAVTGLFMLAMQLANSILLTRVLFRDPLTIPARSVE